MKSGTCPKCKSTDIYTNSDVGAMSKHVFGNDTIRLTLFPRFAMLDSYICGNCGFVEKYVASQKHIDDVKANLKKVGSP